ncbi:hypothetical protein C2G38_2207111 [Gigaspora rosea]|uniref:Uncharacterized protein n=1 Tax=Gigaspora rosea TaxID=44941 RepID=A0A397UIH0_9GLOM|nr:hypothetical protein C2G38_2207111 [Gigaspora rosea]
MEDNISEPTDKETIINLVMKQCKLLFLRTRNPNKKIRETLIKKVVPSMDSVSKEFKLLCRKSREYFDNFRHTFNKDMTALAKNFLVKNCDPTYENIEQFIVGKSLENFIAESLKIHVDYQIAINNQEKPSYSEDALEKIKRLDQLTLHLTIPSASRRNCVNELDLNPMTTPFTVKANVDFSDCSFNAIYAPIMDATYFDPDPLGRIGTTFNVQVNQSLSQPTNRFTKLLIEITSVKGTPIFYTRQPLDENITQIIDTFLGVVPQFWLSQSQYLIKVAVLDVGPGGSYRNCILFHRSQ